MKRRGFLASILSAGFAPAAVGSGVLMPVRKLIVPGPSPGGLRTLAEWHALEMERAFLFANPPVVVDRMRGLIPLLMQGNEILADMPWVEAPRKSLRVRR